MGVTVDESHYVIFGQGVPETLEVLGGPIVFGTVRVEVK